jgi:hypothetical protein
MLPVVLEYRHHNRFKELTAHHRGLVLDSFTDESCPLVARERGISSSTVPD